MYAYYSYNFIHNFIAYCYGDQHACNRNYGTHDTHTHITKYIYMVTHVHTYANMLMLLKFPVMLWSNTPEFYLICSSCAP